MLTRLIFANVGVFTVIMTLRLLTTFGALDSGWVNGVFGLATSWKADVLMYRPWSVITHMFVHVDIWHMVCLLYTSPSPRDLSTSRMPSSA